MTAHASAKGYQMSVSRGKSTMTYEFDVGAKSLSSYRSAAEHPRLQIELVKSARVSDYTWFVPGPNVSVSSTDHAPATLDVPSGFDAVVLSPGGTSGTVLVVPPDGQPFTWQADASGEAWTYATLPATSGKWALSALPGSDPNGSSYVRAVAVKWTRGSITPSSS